MPVITALLAGLIFGVGLIVSGMANPAKVQGFLDLAGAWDPSLALVMAGAVGVYAVAMAQTRFARPVIAAMKAAESRNVDRRLVLGSLVFGVGWGIAGFCPGPALVALGFGLPKAWVFVLAMLAGMAMFELFEWRRRAATAHPA